MALEACVYKRAKTNHKPCVQLVSVSILKPLLRILLSDRSLKNLSGFLQEVDIASICRDVELGRVLSAETDGKDVGKQKIEPGFRLAAN